MCWHEERRAGRDGESRQCLAPRGAVREEEQEGTTLSQSVISFQGATHLSLSPARDCTNTLLFALYVLYPGFLL